MKVINDYFFKKILILFIFLFVSVLTFSQGAKKNVLLMRTIQELVQIEEGNKRAKKKLKALIDNFGISDKQLAQYCISLEDAHEHGLSGFPVDKKKAANFQKMTLEYYKSCASKTEDTECMYNAALLIQNAPKVDDKQVFSYHLKAAELGHNRAQLMVGYAYFKGTGVDKNMATGIDWITKSAKNGNVDAFNYLENFKSKNNLTFNSEEANILSGKGSGFYIKPNYILTLEHVIRSEDSISIKNSKGEPIPWELVATDTENDLALLKVDKLSENFISLSGLNKGYSKANDSIFVPRIKDDLFIIKKGKIIAPDVLVNDKKGNKLDRLMQIDTKIIPGDSGTPILDKDFRLIGISSNAIHKSEHKYEIKTRFGRPLIPIMEFLINNNIEISTKTRKLESIEEKRRYLKAISVEITLFKNQKQSDSK